MGVVQAFSRRGTEVAVGQPAGALQRPVPKQFNRALSCRIASDIRNRTGIIPQSKIRASAEVSKEKAKELRREIEDNLREWSLHGVDFRRKMSMGHFQRLACRTFSIYGEVFVEVGTAPYNGPIATALAHIDPRRVESPPGKEMDDLCRLGIQYSESGAIQGYWVRNSNPGDELYTNDDDYTFIPRYDPDTGKVRIIHVFEQLVPEQSRGFPWLAAAMEEMLDVEDYREAELITKKVEACFGVVVKRSENSQSAWDAANNAANGEYDSEGNRLEELEPGMVHYIDADEDITTVTPQRPGGDYQPFIETAFRSIAAALNMPYEILAKNFFRTTYSSGRLGMQDGKLGFRMRAATLIEQLLAPVYAIAVQEIAWMGLLSIPYREFSRNVNHYGRHTWVGKSIGFIDPKKEIEAYILGNKADIIPKSDIYAETNSMDWEDGLEQIHAENVRQMELEIELRTLRKELEIANGLVVADAEPDEPDEPDDSQEEDTDETDARETQESA